MYEVAIKNIKLIHGQVAVPLLDRYCVHGLGLYHYLEVSLLPGDLLYRQSPGLMDSADALAPVA